MAKNTTERRAAVSTLGFTTYALRVAQARSGGKVSAEDHARIKRASAIYKGKLLKDAAEFTATAAALVDAAKELQAAGA